MLFLDLLAGAHKLSTLAHAAESHRVRLAKLRKNGPPPQSAAGGIIWKGARPPSAAAAAATLSVAIFGATCGSSSPQVCAPRDRGSAIQLASEQLQAQARSNTTSRE